MRLPLWIVKLRLRWGYRKGWETRHKIKVLK